MKTSDQMQNPADAPGAVSQIAFSFPAIWVKDTANEVSSDIFRSAHGLI